ncbi:MAG: alpha/beta fold hydrolase [Myxococcales bacterium]|nr:alpha/beta fold hydrolase [Myxococcales bacterium]
MKRALVLAPLLLWACGSPSPAAPSVAAPPAPAPVAVTAAGEGDQRMADLKTCALDSGEKIEGCKVGFRTFGKLDAKRSNVVLFPTWFTGTTKQLVELVPNKLVDTSKYYLVLVDALGNGVSSSPSASATQPRLRFPKITIHDMVESQRRLLKEALGVEKLHAVVGISMGGMQAYEWAVAHPDDVGRIVPIAGTPQLSSQDLLLWNAELHILDGDATYAKGEYQGRPKMRAVQDVHWMMLSTAGHRNAETSRDAFPAWLEKIESDTTFDWNDWHRQLEAMIAHDVARAHGGKLDEAAKATKAKALVVVAEHDQMVNPASSKAFAAAKGAKLLVLEGHCGHLAPVCESERLRKEVRAFLDE